MVSYTDLLFTSTVVDIMERVARPNHVDNYIQLTALQMFHTISCIDRNLTVHYNATTLSLALLLLASKITSELYPVFKLKKILETVEKMDELKRMGKQDGAIIEISVIRAEILKYEMEFIRLLNFNFHSDVVIGRRSLLRTVITQNLQLSADLIPLCESIVDGKEYKCSNVCVQFSPAVIVCAVLKLASKRIFIHLPVNWYSLVDVDVSEGLVLRVLEVLNETRERLLILDKSSATAGYQGSTSIESGQDSNSTPYVYTPEVHTPAAAANGTNALDAIRAHKDDEVPSTIDDVKIEALPVPIKEVFSLVLELPSSLLNTSIPSGIIHLLETEFAVQITPFPVNTSFLSLTSGSSTSLSECATVLQKFTSISKIYLYAIGYNSALAFPAADLVHMKHSTAILTVHLDTLKLFTIDDFYRLRTFQRRKLLTIHVESPLYTELILSICGISHSVVHQALGEVLRILSTIGRGNHEKSPLKMNVTDFICVPSEALGAIRKKAAAYSCRCSLLVSPSSEAHTAVISIGSVENGSVVDTCRQRIFDLFQYRPNAEETVTAFRTFRSQFSIPQNLLSIFESESRFVEKKFGVLIEYIGNLLFATIYVWLPFSYVFELCCIGETECSVEGGLGEVLAASDCFTEKLSAMDLHTRLLSSPVETLPSSPIYLPQTPYSSTSSRTPSKPPPANISSYSSLPTKPVVKISGSTPSDIHGCTTIFQFECSIPEAIWLECSDEMKQRLQTIGTFRDINFSESKFRILEAEDAQSSALQLKRTAAESLLHQSMQKLGKRGEDSISWEFGERVEISRPIAKVLSRVRPAFLKEFARSMGNISFSARKKRGEVVGITIHGKSEGVVNGFRKELFRVLTGLYVEEAPHIAALRRVLDEREKYTLEIFLSPGTAELNHLTKLLEYDRRELDRIEKEEGLQGRVFLRFLPTPDQRSLSLLIVAHTSPEAGKARELIQPYLEFAFAQPIEKEKHILTFITPRMVSSFMPIAFHKYLQSAHGVVINLNLEDARADGLITVSITGPSLENVEACRTDILDEIKALREPRLPAYSEKATVHVNLLDQEKEDGELVEAVSMTLSPLHAPASIQAADPLPPSPPLPSSSSPLSTSAATAVASSLSCVHDHVQPLPSLSDDAIVALNQQALGTEGSTNDAAEERNRIDGDGNSLERYSAIEEELQGGYRKFGGVYSLQNLLNRAEEAFEAEEGEIIDSLSQSPGATHRHRKRRKKDRKRKLKKESSDNPARKKHKRKVNGEATVD